jgi:hypothetical protein
MGTIEGGSRFLFSLSRGRPAVVYSFLHSISLIGTLALHQNWVDGSGMSSNGRNADLIAGNPRVLSTWKQIAGHFGCNVRTVRRYEQERGLPVHRAPGKKGSTVFAYASELDAWLVSREEEQTLDPAKLAGGPFGRPGGVRHNNSSSTAITLPAISPAEHPAKQVFFLRRRPWSFAAAGLLISSALLVWMVQNRRTVAATTPSKLVALKARPHVPAPGAEEFYLRGRFFWNLRTADSLSKAIDAYIQAIVRDPLYAEGYAGLAECYDLLPQFANADLGQSLAHAESAADRAIALNPDLAAAHRAKGFALFYWDWDIVGSDAEFKRAVALDPNSAQTRQWYAGTLLWRSEGAEAVRQIDEAVRLDPASPAIAADAALLHAQFGDFKSGVMALREIEQTEPTLASPAEFLSALDFNAGDLPSYLEDVRRIASITHAPDDVALAKAVAQGWARAGRTGLLEARAEMLHAAFDHGAESGFLLGETLLLLGRRQEALFYLKASLDRHAVQLIAVQDFPWAKRLSSDPGYAALFDQVRRRIREAPRGRPELARFATAIPQ